MSLDYGRQNYVQIDNEAKSDDVKWEPKRRAKKDAALFKLGGRRRDAAPVRSKG